MDRFCIDKKYKPAYYLNLFETYLRSPVSLMIQRKKIIQIKKTQILKKEMDLIKNFAAIITIIISVDLLEIKIEGLKL